MYGVNVPAGTVPIVVEVEQVRSNVVDGKSNELPVERLGIGVVPVPAVAIRCLIIRYGLTGAMAKLSEFDRIGHAFALRFQTCALIAVHHNEIHAQGLQFGNHLSTVFAHVGSTLFSCGYVAPTAVTSNAEEQRFPTPRHHNTITP
ncbi:MAG: hypothetical protein ACYTBX_06390 [Planctomycetota bacterium]